MKVWIEGILTLAIGLMVLASIYLFLLVLEEFEMAAGSFNLGQ